MCENAFKACIYLALAENEGTIFTSAGFNTAITFKQRKKNYINDYIRNKINA